MKHRSWLTYVHWFGYLTSLIVILQLATLSYFGTMEWIKHQSRRDETRMQSGPAIGRLSAKDGDEVKIALLHELPPLSTLEPDGLRFVAMPSFGDTYFAISLRRSSAGGEGKMVMIPLADDDQAPQIVKLRLSVREFRKLMVDLDTLSASWRGEASWWTDGTGVVFERIRGADVMSGMGNSPTFYGKVGELVFNAVRPSTPQLARFASDWYPTERDSVPEANSN